MLGQEILQQSVEQLFHVHMYAYESGFEFENWHVFISIFSLETVCVLSKE